MTQLQALKVGILLTVIALATPVHALESSDAFNANINDCQQAQNALDQKINGMVKPDKMVEATLPSTYLSSDDDVVANNVAVDFSDTVETAKQVKRTPIAAQPSFRRVSQELHDELND